MRKSAWFLPLLSALLCWLAWPPAYLAPLLLLALVPMLWFADEAMKTRAPGRTLLAGAALGFASWNALSLYWIYHVASEVGPLVGLAVVMVPILFGTVLMSLPFFLYHKSRKYVGQLVSLALLVAYWVAAEYLHHRWDFAFPWLSLGNGFALYPQLVQWYEYTGIFGGTIWILLANILAYRGLKAALAVPAASRSALLYFRSALPFLLSVFLPVLVSLLRYQAYEEKGSPVHVVVVQPNVDPYNEKYEGLPPEEQLQRLLRLSDSLAKANTEYFVWPETALGTGGALLENELDQEPEIRAVRDFLSRYPNGNVVTGASSFRLYDSAETVTARPFGNLNKYYDYFNTALQVEAQGGVQVYHKNKLVPGVEQFPYQKYLSFLGDLMMDLGGTSGSLGREGEQRVFYSQSGIGVVPAICYESVFGGFLADFVGQGAQMICVVTNDGWWKNTAGYKQHAAYARLRAIETRRSVARAANTGISMLINQRGDVLQQTSWWVPTAIAGELHLNADSTFYIRYGDYLARGAVFITLLALIALLILSVARNAVKQR